MGKDLKILNKCFDELYKNSDGTRLNTNKDDAYYWFLQGWNSGVDHYDDLETMTPGMVMVCCVCGDIDESHTAYCGRHGRVPHRRMTLEKQKEFKKMLKKFEEIPNKEGHKGLHKELHKNFDELIADFIKHTEKLPSKTTVMELMKWSYDQTKNPQEEGR